MSPIRWQEPPITTRCFVKAEYWSVPMWRLSSYNHGDFCTCCWEKTTNHSSCSAFHTRVLNHLFIRPSMVFFVHKCVCVCVCVWLVSWFNTSNISCKCKNREKLKPVEGLQRFIGVAARSFVPLPYWNVFKLLQVFNQIIYFHRRHASQECIGFNKACLRSPEGSSLYFNYSI